MEAKKILIFLLIIVLISITLFGMNSVTSMDNLAYVVAVGFDIKDTGKLELSFQIALPSGTEGGASGSSSSQSSSSIVTSVECNSFESGINLVNSYLSKELNLSHCKAVVFSEEIASQGIGEYLYTLINHIEIRPTCNVIISKCNAKYFLNNSSPMLDQLSSKYYEIASTSERVTGYTYNITLLDFFSDFADSFTESFATLGSVNDGNISSNGLNNDSSNNSSSKNNSDQSSSNLSQEGTDDSYVASETPIDSQKNIENLGLAVFKGDKLVGELNGVECIAHLILTNELENAVISVPSPFESTNYIDLLIIHRFDYSTPIGETMEALNEVIKEGKVRYIGASAMYAYQLQKMQDYAEYHNLHKFISMQNHYNLIYREEEREMMKLLVEQNMSSTPYSPLAAGRLARLWNSDSLRARKDLFAVGKYDGNKDKDFQIVQRVYQLAKNYNVTQSEIALNWLLNKKPVASTILGATKTKYIDEAIKALDIKLSENDLNYLEELYVPHKVVGALDK